MAKEKVTSAEKKATHTNVTKDKIVSWYMEYVLENDRMPRNVFKFCKDKNFTEEDFYKHFGSFDGLKKEIWNMFYKNTYELILKSDDYSKFDSREKLLTFYYTFFEILTANRSYVLFVLDNNRDVLKNLEQLKGLRRNFKSFAKELIKNDNEEKPSKVIKNNETVFSEAAWLQLLFLIKFWMDDNSPRLESTDVAIEKSVNTVFDIFDNSPLERLVDFGKFLWKEKMG